MQIERFGWEYEVKRHFPNARPIRRLVGRTVYFAEKDGKFYLIDDRSMEADFICPAQPGVDEPDWVEVSVCDSEDERMQLYSSRWPTLGIQIDFASG